MIKRIWAWLAGGELVWLRDLDGTVTLTIARIDPWGCKTAKRYWPGNTRTVTLEADGTVSNGAYVKLWKQYKS